MTPLISDVPDVLPSLDIGGCRERGVDGEGTAFRNAGVPGCGSVFYLPRTVEAAQVHLDIETTQGWKGPRGSSPEPSARCRYR